MSRIARVALVAAAGAAACAAGWAVIAWISERRARNVFPATVTAVVFEDGDAHVHLDAGDTLVAKVTRGAVEALALRPGAQTYVVIKATALRRLG